MLVQSINEQMMLACRTLPKCSGYVCLLATTGNNWTWYVQKTTTHLAAAEQWFDEQRKVARVYSVHSGSAKLIFAKS